MDDNVRIAGWLAIAFATLAGAERLVPFRRDWHPGPRAWRRDGTVLTINVVVDAVVSVLIARLAMTAAASTVSLPLWSQFILGVASGELVSYWLHRASHCEGWLWRVHLLHHRPSQLNAANALTAHPINAVYDKIGRLLPLLLLGFSDEAILAVTLFTLTQSLVVHANVAGTIGVLDLVIGSARLHRLHHSTRADEAGNFGTAVPWWDLLFGTYRRAGSPRQVGVFEPVRYPAEFSLARLLAWPFSLSDPAGRCCAASAPD